jgi:hypothetical protein
MWLYEPPFSRYLSGFWFLVKSSSVINYTGVVGKLRDRTAALNI